MGASYLIITPEQRFIADVIDRRTITKAQITDKIAFNDADCTAHQLEEMLERWYGKNYDDFILLTLAKKLNIERTPE